MPEPLYFIHIPKTAGTSLRVAMERCFSSSSVFCDYGPSAPETHDLIKKYFYETKDVYELYARILQDVHDQSAIVGHVHFSRYGPLLPLLNTITFVRSPLARLISEYKHFARLKNFNRPLNEFMRKGHVINTQTRYLKNVSVTALGFVGLSEDFEGGLAMINAALNLDLPALNLNVAPSKESESVDLSSEDIALFNELNREDILLYRKVNEIYKLRKELFLQGKPYTHGEFKVDENGMVRGFAFQQGSRSPVSLLIEVNGEIVGETEAAEINTQMRQLVAPRGGYVGFRFAAKGPFESSSNIVVKVRETEQCLLDASISKSR